MSLPYEILSGFLEKLKLHVSKTLYSMVGITITLLSLYLTFGGSLVDKFNHSKKNQELMIQRQNEITAKQDTVLKILTTQQSQINILDIKSDIMQNKLATMASHEDLQDIVIENARVLSRQTIIDLLNEKKLKMEVTDSIPKPIKALIPSIPGIFAQDSVQKKKSLVMVTINR